MSSRQLLVPLLAGLSLLAPRVARAAELKIAYVDLQRAFAEVDEGKAAKARLEQMRDAKQKEIDKEQEVLKKEKETFEKQMATMTEATRTQEGTALQKKMYDLQQRFEKGRAELAQTERETLSGILGKMQPIIQSIAQRDGFTMVFEKTDSGLLYAPASLDLTNELIRMFNEKNKVAGSTPSTSSSKKSTAATTTPATPK
ncbi:MAG: OmpH family outer membrane protein [Myxococcaceae bacterium]